MQLRPYQLDAIEQIRAHFRAGTKRVLLHLSGGAGKTAIFCTMLKGAALRGNFGFVVVKGIQLVHQASERLDREEVPHGVMQGSHWRNLPNEKTQVCSVQTLAIRKQTPPADLIIIDEAHEATSKSYRDLIAKYPDAYIVAVSATPHAKSGLRHIADAVVHPISTQTLIDQGYLCGGRYFVPNIPDLKGVRTVKGEYDTEGLENVMNQAKIHGDLVASYRAKADGKPAIAFAVSVKHSLEITDAFNRAGIPAAHIDANTDQERRKALFRDHAAGSIKVLCNVGVLVTGVDLPYVEVIIMARPTQSYNWHIQAACRGTRIFPGKSHFILLDHAGNVNRHGRVEDERACSLDGDPPREKRPTLKRCDECYFAWQPTSLLEPCPACGAVNAKAGGGGERTLTHDVNTELTEYAPSKEGSRASNDIERLLAKAMKNNYKPGWVYHQLVTKYGEGYAKRVFPALKMRMEAQ